MQKRFLSFFLLAIAAFSIVENVKSAWAQQKMYVDNAPDAPTGASIDDLLVGCRIKTPTFDKDKQPQVEVSNATDRVLRRSTGAGRSLIITYYVCPIGIYNSIQLQANIKKQSSIVQVLISVFDFLFSLIEKVASLLLKWASQLMVYMLGQGKFIRNDIVTNAWPFVQGFANLGFIFALLYIALATTLRLESLGTSIQRLLPKLLIGALLVNFSLVIGGLVIDASRVVMAAEIKLLANSGLTIDTLGDRIIENSKAYEAAFAALAGSGQGFWDHILRKFETVLVVMAIAAGMLIISINLFVRYIILLVLLIFSPLAYLAIALPQTQKYFQEWWGMFLKWVFYGPIAIFFLVIITRIQASQAISIPANGPASTDFLQQLIHLFVIVSLLYVANSVGKKVSGIGSNAVMSLGKRTGSFVRNNPVAATALAGVATGGVGAALGLGAGILAGRAGARGAANVGRDFSDKFKKDFVARARSGDNYAGIPGSGKAAKIIAGVERDDKRNLKKGEKSPGSALGGFVSDKLSLGDPKKRAAANNAKALGTINATNVNNVAISASQLRTAHVGKAVNDINALAIASLSTNIDQIMALLGNKEIISKLDDSQRLTLLANVRGNATLNAPGANPNDLRDAVKKLARTQDAIDDAK